MAITNSRPLSLVDLDGPRYAARSSLSARTYDPLPKCVLPRRRAGKPPTAERNQPTGTVPPRTRPLSARHEFKRPRAYRARLENRTPSESTGPRPRAANDAPLNTARHLARLSPDGPDNLPEHTPAWA
jgi:hypothetical protein